MSCPSYWEMLGVEWLCGISVIITNVRYSFAYKTCAFIMPQHTAVASVKRELWGILIPSKAALNIVNPFDKFMSVGSVKRFNFYHHLLLVALFALPITKFVIEKHKGRTIWNSFSVSYNVLHRQILTFSPANIIIILKIIQSSWKLNISRQHIEWIGIRWNKICF